MAGGVSRDQPPNQGKTRLFFLKNCGKINQNISSNTMWSTADVLRFLIYADIFGMLMLAILFLRGRKLSTLGYVSWGIFALLLPVVGPYFVIAYRPGFPHPVD
jgi:hypothetical protein